MYLVSQFGRRPCHLAAEYGHTDILKMLIKQGADFNAVDLVRCAVDRVYEQAGSGA